MSRTIISKELATNDEAGQGKLNSPEYATEVKTEYSDDDEKKKKLAGMVMLEETVSPFRGIKERVLEKLGSVTSVSADAIENGRHLLDTIVRDATVAAHSLTKDALLRIKSHLLPLIPSLSPSLTTKMVEEAGNEVNIADDDGEREVKVVGGGSQRSMKNVSFASSSKSSALPSSKL